MFSLAAPEPIAQNWLIFRLLKMMIRHNIQYHQPFMIDIIERTRTNLDYNGEQFVLDLSTHLGTNTDDVFNTSKPIIVIFRKHYFKSSVRMRIIDHIQNIFTKITIQSKSKKPKVLMFWLDNEHLFSREQAIQLNRQYPESMDFVHIQDLTNISESDVNQWTTDILQHQQQINQQIYNLYNDLHQKVAAGNFVKGTSEWHEPQTILDRICHQLVGQDGTKKIQEEWAKL